jgi:hypothetical protein
LGKEIKMKYIISFILLFIFSPILLPIAMLALAFAPLEEVQEVGFFRNCENKKTKGE